MFGYPGSLALSGGSPTEPSPVRACRNLSRPTSPRVLAATEGARPLAPGLVAGQRRYRPALWLCIRVDDKAARRRWSPSPRSSPSSSSRPSSTASGPLAFDDQMTSFVKSLPISFDVWLRITDLGGPILIPIGIATVVALLLQHRSRMAVIVGLALLAASVWTQFVKVAVERAGQPAPSCSVSKASASPPATR